MSSRMDRRFLILFTVMLTIAAGNTALQSVLPALGRSLGVADAAVAAAFSVSALLWLPNGPPVRRCLTDGASSTLFLGSVTVFSSCWSVLNLSGRRLKVWRRVGS